VPVSGLDTVLGYALNFAALLAVSEPFIEPGELIVGGCLATPENEAELPLGFYNSHFPPGHRRILEMGLPGIRDAARFRLQSESDPARREFLEAVAISHDAACGYVRKYALLAADLAAREADPTRKLELERIADVCAELASGPPTSLQAALQLVQFSRVFGAEGAIGRLDQWLYRFYRGDVDTGVVDAEGAQALLECFFVKLNQFLLDEARGHLVVYDQFEPNDSLRNITLAGQTPAGDDATNELTYLCLAAASRLRLPEPKLNVRFFDGSPDQLVVACCHLLAEGVNVLAIYNDNVAIPALTRLGIPLEEARDYCNDGCSELIIDGRTFTRFLVHDSLDALRDTVIEADPAGFPTFDDVMCDMRTRIGSLVPQSPPVDGAITFPYFAASMDDCLEQASPLGVRYSIWGSILGEVGNTADGLAAIQRFVYDEGDLQWTELQSALMADFEGYERLRQRLRNRAPKYGNDEDGVDCIAKQVAEHFCASVHESPGARSDLGSARAAGFMLFQLEHKKDLPASPDGRRRGDPVANSLSPAVGMDRSGPTAVLRSASKIDLTQASHGSVVDLALDAGCVRSPAGFDGLVGLVKSFLRHPSAATLQLNVLDRDELLRALENPTAPQYRSLIVRVWGFSAVFVDLHPELQQHVLARTTHCWDA
jgi:formate C-acetyltransferase